MTSAFSDSGNRGPEQLFRNYERKEMQEMETQETMEVQEAMETQETAVQEPETVQKESEEK